MKLQYLAIGLMAVPCALGQSSLPSVGVSQNDSTLPLADGPGENDVVAVEAAKVAAASVAVSLQHETLEDKIAMVEGTPVVVKDLLDQLSTIDTKEAPFIEGAITSFKSQVEAALDKFQPVVEYMKGAHMEQQQQELLESTSEGTFTGTAAARIRRRSLAQDDNYEAKPKIVEIEVTSQTSNDPLRSNSQESFNNDDSSSSKSKKRSGGRKSSNYNSNPFGSHTSPHHHRHQHLKKIQNAIMSGDHEFVSQVLRNAHRSATKMHERATSDASGRRLKSFKRPKITKPKIKLNRKNYKLGAEGEEEEEEYIYNEDDELMGKQCMQLTKCVRKMSVYDMMVYYYSDDLDPTTGELDDSIVHFDEDEVTDRHTEATGKAKQMYKNYRNDPIMYGRNKEDCTDLLRFFHRNIEHGDVPHWEGATVSQVCFAEGTQVHVGLGQIATKVSLKTADTVAEEMYNCAKALYNSDAREYAGEAFVFGKSASVPTDITFGEAEASNYRSKKDYPVKRVIDGSLGKSFWSDKDDSSVNVILTAETDVDLQFDAVTVTWHLKHPKYYKIYVSKDKKSWRQVFLYNGQQGNVGTRGYKKSGDPLVEDTIRLKPSDVTGRYLKLYVTSYGSPDKYGIGIREITAKGSIPVGDAYQGNYHSDFVVPTGLNMDSSVRDEYGQALKDADNLYSYDNIPVNHKLKGYRELAAALFEWLYDNKLSPHPTYRYEYPKKYTDVYDQAGEYFKLASNAKDDKTLRGFMKAALKNNGKPIKEIFPNADVGEIKEDLGDDEEMEDFFLEGYEQIQHGFNMVFGEKASVGFLCGIKEAVEEKGASKFPGSCCLDAPYAGIGDHWGREHVCNAQCIQPGPFFAGLNEAACKAQGGTWCPAPPDCSELQQCINEQIKLANEQGKQAYSTYLEPAIIEDPFSADQCGHSRVYFGYDELYTNDEDICDNFKQLHNTKDFGFLEEFFDQGSGGGGGGEDVESLIPPDRSKSSSKAVSTAQKWKNSLFIVQMAIGPIELILGLLDGMKCPGDITGAVQSTCASVINMAIAIAVPVMGLLSMAYDIGLFVYEMTAESSPTEPMETWENTAVIFDNMEIMYGRMLAMNDRMMEMDEKLSALLEDSVVGRRRALTVEEEEEPQAI